MTEEEFKGKIEELQSDALKDKTLLLAQKIDHAAAVRMNKRLKKALVRIAEGDFGDIDDAREIATQTLKESEA